MERGANDNVKESGVFGQSGLFVLCDNDLGGSEGEGVLFLGGRVSQGVRVGTECFGELWQKDEFAFEFVYVGSKFLIPSRKLT